MARHGGGHHGGEHCEHGCGYGGYYRHPHGSYYHHYQGGHHHWWGYRQRGSGNTDQGTNKYLYIYEHGA
jgi:hypothetical protein